jgi:hypothetical protein
MAFVRFFSATFWPTFATAPRHPWRGKIIVFEVMK